MKNILAIIILLHPLILKAEESEKYKVERVEASQKDGARPIKEIMLSFPDNKSGLPSVSITEFGRTRFAAIKHDDKRLEVIIQFDEFSLDYYDYILDAGKWVLKSQKVVCKLNGALSLALAQVDILEGGAVEIKYHEVGSVARKSSWSDELINKDHKPNEKMNSERYTLKEGGFELVGVPAKLRPRSDSNPKTEEPNRVPGSD
jgi:hypothetical protein